MYLLFRFSLFCFLERFYNSLYWEWLHERLKRERQFSKIEWEPGAGSSGVWFASKVMRISAGKIKNFSKINLNLPGEFQYGEHVELANKKGIRAQPNESVGYIQLRIWKDIPTNQWRHIYQIIKLASTELEKLGFRLPKREPNQKQDTYSALTRKLRLDEFRSSKARVVSATLLVCRRTKHDYDCVRFQQIMFGAN